MRVLFWWQARYLLKLKCHFSWQVQYLVKFGKIAGAHNVVLFHTKCAPSAKIKRCAGGLRTDGFMLGPFSAHARIMVGSAAHLK